MPRLPLFSAIHIANLLLLCALFGVRAHGAELGEAVVRSHIGQPLVADIELTALAPDEAGTLRVMLAHPDVYRGANISMHPALASLNLGIMRRDNRLFLHLTSIKPVDASYIHVFVELIAGTRSSVRASTLWLTPDPDPVSVSVPVSVLVSGPAPAPPPVQPPLEAVHAVPSSMAPGLRARLARAPLEQGAGARLARRADRPSAPAACAQTASPESPMSCVGMDSRNAALTVQIVQLEDKVKALQKIMARKPAPAPTLGAPIGFVPVRPAGTRAAPSMPWAPIGAGVALLSVLTGLAIFWLRRRAAASGIGAGADFRQAIMRPFRAKTVKRALGEPGME